MASDIPNNLKIRIVENRFFIVVRLPDRVVLAGRSGRE